MQIAAPMSAKKAKSNYFRSRLSNVEPFD